MDILDNILKCMKQSGLSQKELCERIGVNKQAFTNWKNGTHSSYTKYLPQIAEVLNVSVDFLLGKTEQKEKPAGITDELWNALCKDDVKMDLAIQISRMSPEKAKRVLALLQAAQMLPPAENDPTDKE